MYLYWTFFLIIFEQYGSCVQSIYIALGILIYLIQITHEKMWESSIK